MQPLQLKFLGDLEVVRAGRAQALPPSRKTRALLAYLALNDRSFRREHLCELLWEVPDDPRGSLRWSLSKLRKLVDDIDHPRVVADRTHVRFDSSEVEIDTLAIRRLASGNLADTPLEVLEQAVHRYEGHFLEGLELSNFYDFHAWCVAERELALQAQASLLREIVRRKRSEPESALSYARALVALLPYDENARAELIALLVSLGRMEEAEQQHRLGSRMLAEAGAQPIGTLTRALRGGADTQAPPRAAPASPAAPLPQPNAALLGRQAELDEISVAILQAREKGQARIVLIRGEPGIGKSRLLEATAEIVRSEPARILESIAFESESIRPFALWIDAMRRYADDESREIFGGAEGENRERLLAGLSDFVTRQSEPGLVALLFDDVQWIDESSAAALHYVVRTNRHRPVVGILAAREAELRDNAALQQALQGLRHAGLLREVRLGPLPEDALRELIEEQTPGCDSARLCRECGGNPLFAIELARAEASGDSGSSLGELVRERLSRFDVESADVLRWAAVLSPRIDLALLERVTDLPAQKISTALESAEQQAILRASDRGLRFSHDLVAQSVYTDISPARRGMMHRRMAELLEERTAIDLEHAADLAYHASQCGDPVLAARAMVSAGRLCLRFFANEEALSLARKGLNLVENLSDRERVCITIDLRDIMLTASPLEDWEAAVREYEELAERALDHGALSHARLAYFMASHVRWMHGHWSGARDQILQSERVVRAGSDEEHVVGMAEAAKCLALLERDLAHADAMLMEAKAIAARKSVVHDAIPAALGMLRFHENKLDEAEELFEDARMLAKGQGNRINEYQINEYLVMIDIERGRFAAARSRCDALLEIGTKLREGSEAPFAKALGAVCDYALGSGDAGLEPAFEELRIVDAKHRLAYALTRAAMLDLEGGLHARAIERAEEALSHAKALDRATDILLAHIVLAQVSRATNDEEAFARHAATIAELDDGRAAEWARRRASTLLSAAS
jgi:DNA-binding SARP family transcriptional activator